MIPKTVVRAVLVLWACSVAVAILFLIRGCAQEGLVVVRVEVPRLEFVEK